MMGGSATVNKSMVRYLLMPLESQKKILLKTKA